MIQNFITIAFRNLARHKAFSIINILGLSIGISAALVIFLITYFEFSYDKNIPDNDRVYHVVMDIGTEGHSGGLPAPLGAAIQNELTGIEHTIPVFTFQRDATAKVEIAKVGSDKPTVFKSVKNIVFTNNTYFYMMPFQWIAGSPEVSMKEPFSTVMTESRAKQYFPSMPISEIMGKQVTYNGDLTTTITGIVKDFEGNTSFPSVEFISFATIAKTKLQDNFLMNGWDDWMAYAQLYVKLGKETNALQTASQITDLYKRNIKDSKMDMIHTISYRLLPLKDMHFDSQYGAIGVRTANKKALVGLFVIAGFLLLLGCINFINLTTANATQRAKEIGIRKTMGSSRKQLVMQFMGETFFITTLATLLSVCFTPFLLYAFQDFIPEGVRTNLLATPAILLYLCLLIIVVSVLSGFYPAMILSGYRPVSILKGQAFANSKDTRQAWFRKSLTVSQFVIAQFFIIATIVMSKQINYGLNADLGFNKEAIITFEGGRDTSKIKPQRLLNAIKAMPEVQLASTGFFSPADEGVAFTNIKYAEKPDLKVDIQIRWGDPNFINVYNLKLLAGKNVAASDDFKEVIINETYAKLLDFKKPEDAIGKTLIFNDQNLPIVGVMQDFHDQSVRTKISPLVLMGNNGSIFHIRLQPNTYGTSRNNREEGAWKSAIAKIQKAFYETYPDGTFEYQFFDEKIAKLYEQETRTASLLTWATGLAIFISCLGLLGLVMYTINTRTKEIGIRKILGASDGNIVGVLSTDFMKLVLIAFLIATPLAWWVMFKWLQDFAYRTPLSWWVFALSGGVMLLIALLTLSVQTVKAAVANPVKSLRTE
jgi:putative ABC transport system permease protein